MCFEFNRSNPDLLVAGCLNGQIVVWDISEYHDKLRLNKNATKSEETNTMGKERTSETPILRYAASSLIESSHRGPVTDLIWFPKFLDVGPHGETTETKDSEVTQFATCSLDGQVMFWDLRFKHEGSLKALDLTWKPFYKSVISSLDNTFEYGCTRLSIRGTNVAAEKSKSNSGN